MKRIFFILMVTTLMSLPLLSQIGAGESFLEYYTAPDKILHISAGFAISGLVVTVHSTANPMSPLVNSVGLGIITGMLAGATKEVLFDEIWHMGTPDAGDFYATMYGSILGSLTTALSIRLSRKWMYRRYYDSDITVMDFKTGKEEKLKL